jgi:hypothetical protein
VWDSVAESPPPSGAPLGTIYLAEKNSGMDAFHHLSELFESLSRHRAQAAYEDDPACAPMVSCVVNSCDVAEKFAQRHSVTPMFLGANSDEASHRYSTSLTVMDQ